MLKIVTFLSVSMSINVNKFIHGDALQVLSTMPDKSVHCIVTSPPYYGLRDYGIAGQIGLEESPEEFIQKLVNVFRECRRVLDDKGTLWVNMGDSYAHSTKNTESFRRDKKGYGNGINRAKRGGKRWGGGNIPSIGDLKPKDMIGIPWMLAFALRADGWYLRQDIIWAKPNPMPESVTDRCTKSHEYIFLLSKAQRYYYDQKAIAQPLTASSISRLNQDIERQEGSHRAVGKTNGAMKAVGSDEANKRSVWSVATKPFKEAHFATFPEELIVDCIKAGCPNDGVVLDPFSGAGTTALVARKLNRKFIGIELNAEYIAIANKRLDSELGLFK